MSRAYRISVRECLNRTVRAKDHVSTQLEVLEILPPEEMAELLAAELEARGFERQGKNMVREQDGVLVTVDIETGTVTVHAEGAQEVNVEAQRDGWAADQSGKGAKAVKEGLQKQLQKDLEGKADAEREKLQAKITDKLEAQLGDVKKELNQAVNRVTAEALKRKAAQLGQIKQLTEDAQTGSMTIVLEV
jgi:hypothetical protein